MSAGLPPNTGNIALVAKPTTDTVRVITHPEYQYWRSDWQKLRDVLAGQREVKAKGEIYLPSRTGGDKDDYGIYLRRATFYNMTAQTLNGMLGQVFRKDPIVRGLPDDKYDSQFKRFAKDGSSLLAFIKTTMSEQIGMGRFGALIDAPGSVISRAAPNSYAVGYTCENILDWTIEDIDGFYVPTRILLREFVRDSDYINRSNGLSTAEARLQRFGMPKNQPFGGPSPSITPSPNYTSAYIYITMYRELLLEPVYDTAGNIIDRVYRQYVYKDDPTRNPLEAFTPMVRGQPLRFIPFVFFGAMSNTADVEKSPLLDICDLNLSHYINYADLEWGRMYTALPVYYAPGNDSEQADVYSIGPSKVWEVPEGQIPGVIEFKGEGLKGLESALNTKEEQISAIGGRLMPGTTKSVSESDNQTNLRESNEQSLLLNVIQAAEGGIALLVRWWLMWRDVPLENTIDLSVAINKDFTKSPIGAREIRAIQMLYSDGFIPVEVLFEYLRKAEVIESEVEVDEFKAMLLDPKSFINNPDVGAKMRGYASRAQEIEQATMAREADQADRKLALTERDVEINEEKLRIAAAADSTSIVGARKLGDPEQAQPSKLDAATLALAKKKADQPPPAVAPPNQPPANGPKPGQ